MRHFRRILHFPSESIPLDAKVIGGVLATPGFLGLYAMARVLAKGDYVSETTSVHAVFIKCYSAFGLPEHFVITAAQFSYFALLTSTGLCLFYGYRIGWWLFLISLFIYCINPWVVGIPTDELMLVLPGRFVIALISIYWLIRRIPVYRPFGKPHSQ